MKKFKIFTQKKFFTAILGALALVMGFVSQASAATLQVTSIGTESIVSGTPGTESYVGSNPTIIGVASPEAEVDVMIDDLTTTVVADLDGDWSYTPTTLTGGEYSVEISSNLEVLTFTLTISSSSSSEATGSGGVATSGAELPAELPQSGTGEAMILTIAAGMFFIGLSLVISNRVLLVETVE